VGRPIEDVLLPVEPRSINPYIAMPQLPAWDTHRKVRFTLVDTGRGIFGNTALYLTRLFMRPPGSSTASPNLDLPASVHDVTSDPSMNVQSARLSVLVLGQVLHLDLPQSATVSIRIFDVAGRKVETLCEKEVRAAGRLSFPLSSQGEPLRSGIYFYEVHADDQRASGKLLVIN